MSRARVPFTRGRDTRTHKAKPASKGGSAIPAGGREISRCGNRELPLTSPILASPFGVHRQSAPKVSRFRAGCAATPEAPLLSISAVLPGFPSDPRALAGMARQRRRPGAIRGDVPQGRREALAQGAALGSRDAPARPAWRRHRPHRARHAVRAAVRLPEPSHGPARPVARRDRARRPAAAGALSSTRWPGCAISGCCTGSAGAKRRATPRAGSGCGSGPTPTGCCRRRNGEATATTTRRRPIRRRWARLSAFPTR